MRDNGAWIGWVALVMGAMAGLATAYWVQGFGLAFPSELKEARELGIVSRLILQDYPKSRDLIGFMLVAGLPVMAAIAFWWPFRNQPRNLVPPENPLPSRRAALWGIGVALLLFLASWHQTLIRVPNFNDYAGAWPLLGEQGATLAWVQSISSGGIFGRDFFSLYGPMFVYPLAWWMDFTGDYNALVERQYKIVLNALAFGFLGYGLLTHLRSRLLATLFVVILWMMFPALCQLSANTNILRSVLGLVVIGCIVRAMQMSQWRTAAVGGAVLGQALLFSQEVGMSALLTSLLLVFIAPATDAGQQKYRRLTILGALLLATAASMAPMTAYLVANGAGAAMLDSLVGYPRLVMLGFGGLEFPDLRALFESPRHFLIHYSVIAIYVGSAIAILVAAIQRQWSFRLLLATGLTVFGLLLFRQALGRSDTDQTLKVIIPAILLTALWMEELWQRIWSGNALSAEQIPRALLLLAVVSNLIVGVMLDPLVKLRAEFSWASAIGMPGKFDVIPTGIDLPRFPRLSVFVDPATASTLTEVDNFLQSRAAPDDAVYFFPNEAAYYFLLNRKNPTRYALSYFAASYERQREITADLERSRCRYVVFNKRAWRIDNIPESVQVPIIVEYIQRHYRFVETLYTTDIYERVP